MDWKQVDAKTAEQGLSLLRRLAEYGYEGYFVGGCVRDEWMNRPMNDMDIATNAKPEQVIELFEHTVPTGIAHGTITVLVDGEPFELTTYRTESQYVDHRRPEQVEFVSDLYEDLKRRDFTMNAMARGLDGEYVDPFHGRKDISNQLIRCVGNPEERFEEDALRMLRGIRFASVFGFTLEENTWQALLHRKDLISYIAAERIRIEMEKMIAGPHPYVGIQLLQQSRLTEYMKVKVPCPPQYPELLSRLTELPSSPAALRWALIVLALGVDVDDIRPLLKEWTFSNVVIDQITKLLRMNTELDEVIREEQSSNLNVNQSGDPNLEQSKPDQFEKLFTAYVSCVLNYGRETAEHWSMLYKVLPQHQHDKLSAAADHAEEWLSSIKAFSLADVNINGEEMLTALQMRGGPWLGKLMNHILLQVAAGKLDNERTAILDYARDHYKMEDESNA